MEVKPINPANAVSVSKEVERQYLPMNVPMQTLEAPEIPGHACHWFYGTPARLSRAQRAGFVRVEADEIWPNEVGLGNASTASGNSSLGSNVTAPSGTELGRDGQPIEMVLMKIPLELKARSDKILDDRNESVAAAIRGDGFDAKTDRGNDRAMRYLDKDRTSLPNMFTRKGP